MLVIHSLLLLCNSLALQPTSDTLCWGSVEASLLVNVWWKNRELENQTATIFKANTKPCFANAWRSLEMLTINTPTCQSFFEKIWCLNFSRQIELYARYPWYAVLSVHDVLAVNTWSKWCNWCFLLLYCSRLLYFSHGDINIHRALYSISSCTHILAYIMQCCLDEYHCLVGQTNV